MTDKLTKAQREQIIFNHLKGKEDPLYEVSQTKYGKYIVKPKQIQLEEETINEPEAEEEQEDEPINEPQQMKPTHDKQQARRERRKRNRRAKQDAKRILDALTNLINSNNGSDSSDDDTPRAPQIIEQPNFNPQQLSFRRRRLAF